jgi:hypothetical protein
MVASEHVRGLGLDHCAVVTYQITLVGEQVCISRIQHALALSE